MRYSPGEKLEIIRLVEESELPVKQTLAQIDINRSTFYTWYRRYLDDGYEGLKAKKPNATRFWNRIPDHERKRVRKIALDHAELSPRELAWRITDQEGWYISESSVYRILKAYDLITSPAFILMSASDSFKHPTRQVNELWQTDFTYFKVIGWGVTDTLDLAVAKTGVEQVQVRHRPRLLSDNGPCYVSKELREYLAERAMTHTRGKPYHPMTQGKIERYHRTMKNVVKLQHYYAPGELEAEIGRFVDYYNRERVHESLQNLRPADVFEGRSREILGKRYLIKQRTIARRREGNRLEWEAQQSRIVEA